MCAGDYFGDVRAAAASIGGQAARKGSEDNLTITVIEFGWCVCVRARERVCVSVFVIVFVFVSCFQCGLLRGFRPRLDLVIVARAVRIL